MAKYFLKLSGSNNIENIIEWDGVSTYTPPPGYVIELVTTTASINYAPSASKYEEPIFGGKLFGEFSGELTGSIIINGQTLDDIVNETPYGTLTLYSSSIRNTSVQSGSFKINDSGSIFLPLLNNKSDNQKYPYYSNYSSSFAKIINNQIKDYVVTFKNKENPFAIIEFLVNNTEVTSSVSASISNTFYKLSSNKINDTLSDLINQNLIDSYNQYYGTEWYINFDFRQKEKIVESILSQESKYGSLLYNAHIQNTDPGSGYFSINSTTVWSEATELYISLDNYEKTTEISSSKYNLYNSTINSLFNEKIVGSTIKLQSGVINDNTYKIFEITNMNIVSGSGNNYVKLDVTEKSSYTDGNVLLALGQKFNVDFEIISKNKRQTYIVTGSRSFYAPYWAKDIVVITIGAGGGGGGGIQAKDTHQFSVGGAGGSGGSIAYSQFNNLTGGVRIDCFVGEGGQGGNTGSVDDVNSYGLICPTCDLGNDFNSFTNKNSTVSDTIPPTVLNSTNATIYDILDQYVPTASAGTNGGSTFAYVYENSSSNQEINFLSWISAPGGIGGSGGYSLGLSGSISASAAYDLLLINKFSPISIPGGTNLNTRESAGDVILGGGPGGYGISLPIFANDFYSNYAPSLPWGTEPITPGTQSIIKLPFGINQTNSRNKWDTLTNGNPVIIVRRDFESNNDGDVILIQPQGAASSSILPTNYLSFDKPKDIGITGGGGGTGWVTSSLVVTSSMRIGSSGSLLLNNSLFDYTLSTGGNGGNRSTLGGLSIQLPQTGSGYGAGGGGGASDVYGGTAQNGASGKSGAVVIICLG